jgi:nucleotide-diphospho-sugar transferase
LSLLPLENDALLAKARQVAGSSGDVIITFCNSAYREVLANWLVPIRRYGSPVLVCALDAALAGELESEGIPVICVSRGGQADDAIWAIRAQVVHALVTGGLGVIHSDVDAVWMKNPLELLDRHDADIVSSQGTVHPRACHAVWGHVLCYGFIKFRARGAVGKLLGKAAESAAREQNFDDQRCLNEQLLSEGVKWTVQSPYRISFAGTAFACSPEPIIGEGVVGGLGLRVVILPHAQVQRLPNSIEDPSDIYVTHPLSPKKASDKKITLRDRGAWFLDGVYEKAGRIFSE